MPQRGKEQRFVQVSSSPQELDPRARAENVVKAIQLLQSVERDYIGKDHAFITIPHMEPIMVMTVGDLHMGSISTDYDMILQLRDAILADPNIGVVMVGDEIEGLKAAYMDTNVARTPIAVHEQIDLVRELFLGPLADEGRILAMVSGYFGHNGWVEETTVNPWLMLTQDYDIPIVRNGGTISLQYPNGHGQTMKIWHNPPGKSMYDPVYGLRRVLQQISLPDRPNFGFAGHTHRAGVAKEYAPEMPVSDKLTQALVVVNSGTAKGSNTQLPPDRFGVKLGLPEADPLGQGVLIQPRIQSTGRKLEMNYPFLTQEHGMLLFAALQLMNRLEQQQLTAEMLGRIHSEVEEKPDVSFVGNRSRRVRSPFEETAPSDEESDEDKYERYPFPLQPQYERAVFNVTTRLPVSVDFIQNVRHGSNSEGTAALEQYMGERFRDNPHALIAFLRNLIDTDVASDPARVEILNRFIALGAQFPDQVLVLLHDANLRINSWKKQLDVEEDGEPLPAGSYLAHGMGAKLIRHQSSLQLHVGPENAVMKPQYSILTLDKLGRHGSTSRPTFGHTRMYDLYAGEKPGAVVGGHMSHSGFSSRFDGSNQETDNPVFIQPGWWASTVNTQGKGNAGAGALPGQALILLPGKRKDDYMAFPTSNPEETQLVHEALLLWKGLEILGEVERVQ